MTPFSREQKSKKMYLLHNFLHKDSFTMADSLFYRERKEQVINKNPLLKNMHNEVSSNSKVQYNFIWEKRNW